jgi:4-hydroxy-tetrahydrodipicolinate reductase
MEGKASMIKILVNGAAGRMGKAMAANILAQDDMQIVGAVDLKCLGTDIGELTGSQAIGVKIENELDAALKRIKPDIMLDFTNPQIIMKSIRTALSNGVACVVGTTGLTEENLQEADALSHANKAPIFAASNFAISAVLMMRFAAEAVKYMPNFEIVELHGPHKLDAPSGTAITTAKMICANREVFSQEQPNSFELIPGVRGGDYNGAKIHSVRVPGVISTQDCIFGAPGQLLVIRAESTHWDCFFPGVALALRKVLQLEGMTFGLDKLL